MKLRSDSKFMKVALASMFASSLLFGITLRGANADEATASPTGKVEMGDCVVSLGIGKPGDSCINVIHASPDAPAVDVYLDGAKALTGLAFGKTSGWVAVPSGDHQVQVTATGAEIATAVIDGKVNLAPGAAYEVAAVGLLANIAPQINQVDLSAFGENEMTSTRIRVIHASPDAPAVDVAIKDGDVLIPNLAFPTASAYLTVPSGTYGLEVRLAGTTTVALDLPGVKLDPSMVYSVYAIGQVGDKTLTVLVVTATTIAPMTATPTS